MIENVVVLREQLMLKTSDIVLLSGDFAVSIGTSFYLDLVLNDKDGKMECL